ncbi:MAG TPA: hypothetical protein VL133_05185, partial [Devosia sp.]|nr:hypothetical protein [Devosia sp.]
PSVARPIISFIPGAPPAAGIAITGCSFEPRCRFGKGRDVCLALRPLLHNVDGNGHAVACHFPGAELNADAAAIAAETSGTIHHAGGDAHAPHGGQ